jgi:TonB family protein
VERPARSRWWLPVAFCLISGIGGAVIYELWTVAREPRWVELHLDAKASGKQLDVTWDPTAPRAVNATRALLGVTDGGQHHDIELTPAQMRAGKYSYTPAHGDVALRLILYGKGVGVAGDAVHVTAIPNVVETAAAGTASATADRAAPPPETVTPPTTTATTTPAVPPSTVREVQPRIPAGIRSRIQGEVVIPVTVQINEKGRVTGAAAAMRGGDGLHRYLAEQAEKAARQWRFTPAKTSRGTRVASSKTVHFVFEP